MQLIESWCESVWDGSDFMTEPVSIFHDAEEIRNANNPGYYHGVMGDTFIVDFMTGSERRN